MWDHMSSQKGYKGPSPLAWGENNNWWLHYSFSFTLIRQQELSSMWDHMSSQKGYKGPSPLAWGENCPHNAIYALSN